ncbi:MAG: hypothetical protein ABGZ23_15395 [Fuerstiella sp.]
MEKLPNDGIVVDENNVPVWNLKEYSFIKEGERAPLTVNPSLWRQAQLLMIAGLFQVHDNIHQVRGADLANITFIEGPAGIVVVDPLTCSAGSLPVACVHRSADCQPVYTRFSQAGIPHYVLRFT